MIYLVFKNRLDCLGWKKSFQLRALINRMFCEMKKLRKHNDKTYFLLLNKSIASLICLYVFVAQVSCVFIYLSLILQGKFIRCHFSQSGKLAGADIESCKFFALLLLLFFSHCVKSIQIRSYSGPHFPAFGLNAERYGPK